MNDKSQQQLIATIRSVLEALPQDDAVVRLAAFYKLVQDAANMPAEGLYTAFLTFIRNHDRDGTVPSLHMHNGDRLIVMGTDHASAEEITRELAAVRFHINQILKSLHASGLVSRPFSVRIDDNGGIYIKADDVDVVPAEHETIQ